MDQGLQSATTDQPSLAGPTIWMLVSLAALSAAMTILFMSMRAVMEIGGFCAEGGPYVVATPCPEGIAALMPLAIVGGVIFAFVYAFKASKAKAPSLIGLAWPALFLPLGWNFLEFGLNPPGGSGLAWGWLVCAAVFVLMGGVPLIFALPHIWRSARGNEQPKPRMVVEPRIRARGPAVADALTKLDVLHRSGALDDQEFEEAKDQVLGEEP